jgi:hypothetical protein
MASNTNDYPGRNLSALLGLYIAICLLTPILKRCFYYSSGEIQMIFLVSLLASSGYLGVISVVDFWSRRIFDGFAYLIAAFFGLAAVATYIPELGK